MHRQGDQLEPLAALMREQVDGSVDAETDRRGREQVLKALAEPQPSRRPRWRMAAALAAATVLAVVLVLVLRQPTSLEYTLEGPVQVEGEYVRAADEPARLRFSDGSSMQLDARTACRVRQLDERGAQLQLEHGRLMLQVVPRAEGRWQVEAGPFTVVVTGTRFSVGWEPASQQLMVTVTRGSVQVRGGAAGDGVALRAGQQLQVDGARNELHVGVQKRASATASPSSQASAPSAPVVSAQAAPSTHPSGDRVAVPAIAAKPSWSQRVADADYAAVMAEADARGIDNVLSSVGLADLVALSDAARYSGRSGVARRALMAMRERFAGSEPARTAAFLLGRMAEGGSPTAALRWYDTYLAESPGGGFAAEALGRKMVALQRSGSAPAAEAAARRYLANYPSGPYASAAKTILAKKK